LARGPCLALSELTTPGSGPFLRLVPDLVLP
jgi:hypothetical protein